MRGVCFASTEPGAVAPSAESSMLQSEDSLVWMDLEMTGLDVEVCGIIEIATLITNNDLEIVATGPVLAIHQPDEMLDAMAQPDKFWV